MTLTTETIKQWRSDAENIARRSCEYETEYSAAEAILALTAELLANREAQPVIAAWQHKGEPWRIILDRDIEEVRKTSGSWSPLYTAPPAPAVPREISITSPVAAEYVAGWNACRAAMLAQPVSSGYTLPDNVREALTLALQAMEFMGDALNNIDAVCTEDVEFVTPAFTAVRGLLAAAPEGGNG